MPRYKAFFLLALISFLLPALSRGAASTTRTDTFDLEADRLPLTSLNGPWRFHPGDNPAWAQPNFDDHDWHALKASQDWPSQGYTEQNGFAWFRFRLLVPAGTPSLLLQLPLIDRNFQLFANGKLIAQVGNLPPQPSPAVVPTPHLFTVPLEPSAGPHTVTIALRMYFPPMFVGVMQNMLRGGVYAGEASAIKRQFALTKANTLLAHGGEYTLDVVVAVVAIASLILYWFDRRRQGFYLWLVCFAAAQVLGLPLYQAERHWAINYAHSVLYSAVLDFAGSAAVIFLVVDLLNLPRSRALVPTICMLLAEISALQLVFFHTPLVWADSLYFLFVTAMYAFVAIMLFRAWRAGNIDAGVLLLGYGFSAIISFLIGLSRFLVDLNVPHAEVINPFRVNIIDQPFAVTWDETGNMIFTLCMLGVLAHRFVRTSRERERYASALQAAHEVQYQLVPSNALTLGGFSTEVAYIAAEEVGGDFCQVLPRADGSLLIALGDVSGKGLRAAMLGTLCVGALRSVAEEEIGPAAALERLNRAILRTEYAGFVTCLCALISPSGVVSLANAGHLSPYLDGIELSVEAGLPLGIVNDPAYAEQTFSLPEGSRLTILSDGVVEARSASGELFGFDRTKHISQQTAAEIAAKAQLYGPQQDDITVLTLDWNLASLLQSRPLAVAGA
ncbi:PP2C family protein-serine/threonine phosphatase [Terriglobus aquaticus]|uniref:SpoIIE family protein phosphatase n=1 Tax=Terriglobus aquaticus TaxID=940139 RepID=A0ABW9KG36_9BACT|nr:SpoIIE family protein phosphatase [Terriglobus aquaticus]